MNEKLAQRVNELILKVIEKDINIIPEQSFVEDLGFSSLQVVELICYFENEFDVLIPVEKVLPLKTVGDMYRLVEDNLVELHCRPGEGTSRGEDRKPAAESG